MNLWNMKIHLKFSQNNRIITILCLAMLVIKFQMLDVIKQKLQFSQHLPLLDGTAVTGLDIRMTRCHFQLDVQ